MLKLLLSRINRTKIFLYNLCGTVGVDWICEKIQELMFNFLTLISHSYGIMYLCIYKYFIFDVYEYIQTYTSLYIYSIQIYCLCKSTKK